MISAKQSRYLRIIEQIKELDVTDDMRRILFSMRTAGNLLPPSIKRDDLLIALALVEELCLEMKNTTAETLLEDENSGNDYFS